MDEMKEGRFEMHLLLADTDGNPVLPKGLSITPEAAVSAWEAVEAEKQEAAAQRREEIAAAGRKRDEQPQPFPVQLLPKGAVVVVDSPSNLNDLRTVPRGGSVTVKEIIGGISDEAVAPLLNAFRAVGWEAASSQEECLPERPGVWKHTVTAYRLDDPTF